MVRHYATSYELGAKGCERRISLLPRELTGMRQYSNKTVLELCLKHKCYDTANVWAVEEEAAAAAEPDAS